MLPDIDTPIWPQFEAMCRRQPDALAVDDDARRFTYSMLRRAALSLAGRLQRQVAPGTLVAAVLRHSAEHPIAVLACLASGHPVLALDAYHPAARHAQTIADAHAVLLDSLAEMAGPAFEPSPATANAPAFVIGTSGSTGAPKGVVLSQRNLLHQVAQDMQSCIYTAADRFLPLGSPAAISPLRGMLSALLSGGALFLRDLHDGFSGIFAAMREQRITVARIGPSLLRTMVELPGAAAAFRSMRIIRVGGETLSGQDVIRMRNVLPASCTLVFAYGSTELPPLIERLVPAHGPIEQGPLAIGAPLPGSELRIIDAHGAEVAAGDPGELLVRGQHLALGYWIGGTCVPGDIVPDPNAPDHRSFRSGDWLRRRADGQWEFLGRVDHQVKIRGNRIEPAETEAVLRAQPGVADAVVMPFGTGDAVSLIAFVVASAKPHARFVDGLRAALSEQLADHARPSVIRLLDAIPRLNSFKPDFAALSAREVRHDDG